MNKLNYFIFALALTIPLMASAGKEGGGGKGVVCRAGGAIKSVELLDLWEAREVYGRPAAPGSDSVAEQIARNIKRLKYSTQIELDGEISDGGAAPLSEPDYLEHELQKTTAMFLAPSARVRRVRNVALTLTDDSFELAQPSGGCKVEQIIDFVDSPVLPLVLVNQDLVDRMNATNLAALYLHEAFYLYMRGYQANLSFVNYREPDSIRVRRAIGFVFAGDTFPSLKSILKGKKYVLCRGRDGAGTSPSQFYSYTEASGIFRVLITQLFGRPSIGFFPEQIEVGMSPSVVATPGSCDQPSHPPELGPGTWGLAMGGPVDFQTMTWIDYNCESGRWAPYLQQDSSTRFQADLAQKLECEVVNGD